MTPSLWVICLAIVVVAAPVTAVVVARGRIAGRRDEIDANLKPLLEHQVDPLGFNKTSFMPAAYIAAKYCWPGVVLVMFLPAFRVSEADRILLGASMFLSYFVCLLAAAYIMRRRGTNP